MDELLTKVFIELSKYGLTGIIIGVAVFFIYRMQGIYQQERSEWREEISKLNNQFLEVTSRQHDQLVEVTKDTHTILSEIRMLLTMKK